MKQQSNNPPLHEGEVIENLKIISIGKKGDGVGKVNNFVIIVPNTEEDKSYTIKVTKVLPTVAFGVIHEQ